MKSLYLNVFLFFLCLHGWTLEYRGRLIQNEIWSLEQSPYVITNNLIIPEGIQLIIEAGVEIRLLGDVNITIFGDLQTQGSTQEPIHFIPDTESQRWGAISIEDEGSASFDHTIFRRGSHADGQRIGMVNAYQCVSAVNIHNCTFEDWPDDFSRKATQAYQSKEMFIRRCYFGPGTNEAVHGVESYVLVEHCLFDKRYGYSDAIDIGYAKHPNPVPEIRYNTFLGSEDDGIDLDECDAYVEGNLVMNCRGGDHDPIGISGDRGSRPMIVNNVIYNCHNGIAFKNGADIFVYNNTIVNCDRGIWMHQNPAHAEVINTIIWGKDNQESIRLETGSTVDVSYSIIKGKEPYPGEGNLSADPLFVNIDDLNFQLQASSSAIDHGLMTKGVTAWDIASNPRIDIPTVENQGAGEIPYIDIGAYEYQPRTSGIEAWMEYLH